jgi:hypothetical protein
MSHRSAIRWVWAQTFFSSSFLSNAHFCLHCSQVTGGPYFFSELAHRWHLLLMKPAMMLQYWHALGLPYSLTFCSHFLQIVDVLPFLKVKNSNHLLVHASCNNLRGKLHQSSSKYINRFGWEILQGRSMSLTCSAGTPTGKKYISLLGRNLYTPVTQSKFFIGIMIMYEN